ncbi:hypothetical protein [Roseovarius sp. MMSF_3350]|uniref:hypothetical protein n=1 Tax=Roseovarius sp. MMSF_3350 TaxID=3046706 RepID=UPI00273ECB08|nr:hypothetical protein [Roseovarius sp. MMSF_3350]
MRPGEDRFTEVPVEGYRGVRYDARSGHLLFRFEDRPLQEWTEEAGLRPSPLAGASPEMNDLLPMYFAGAAGYMSFSGDQLYWRAETAGDWQRVRLGWFDRHVPNDIWTLDPRRSYLDAASGLFALQFSQDLLVFDVSGNGVPELLYAVRDVTRVFHADDGPIVAVLGGVLLDKKRRQHFVRVIGRDGPHRVRADDATVGETAKSLAVPWNGVVPSGRGVPPLFGIGHPVFNVGLTWMYFDGAQFIAAPELGLEKTGPHPRWIQWQERLFLLDLRGWWEVQRDLTLTPGALPISFEWMFEVEIEVSETFDAIFAGHSEQGLWVSRNGLDFARVETGDVPIRRYVTDLPGGEAGVVLADDGLYLIDGTCVDEVVR